MYFLQQVGLLERFDHVTGSKLENMSFIMYHTEFQASFAVSFVRRVYPCISVSRMCCILGQYG